MVFSNGAFAMFKFILHVICSQIIENKIEFFEIENINNWN